MTGTGPELPAESATSEDHAYFQALEQEFLRLRGKGTMLSAADWQVAQGWRRAGVPLELVVRVMEELFARARERRRRTISSLGYFRAAVEGAWEEVVALSAGGRKERLEPFGTAERLGRLAEALPPALPERERRAAAIRGLDGEVDAIERSLAGLDQELIADLERTLATADREALDAELEAALSAAARRLPRDEVEAARRRFRTQLLRRRFSVPVLSLFSPEARDPGPAPAS
jgi:hypothetical protein